MASLSELLERVEACTGPDREIDAEIVAWLNNASVRRYPPTDDFGPRDRWQFWSLDGAHFLGSEGKFPVPPLTASIDAALALVEKRIPPSPGIGREFSEGFARDGEYWWNYRLKFYSDDEGEPPTVYWGTSFSNGPIAVLRALLRSELSRSLTKGDA